MSVGQYDYREVGVMRIFPGVLIDVGVGVVKSEEIGWEVVTGLRTNDVLEGSGYPDHRSSVFLL